MMTKLQLSDLRDIKRGRGRGGWLAESFTVMGSLPVSFMLESRTFISQKELGISAASAACPENMSSRQVWSCVGVVGSPLLVVLTAVAEMGLLSFRILKKKVAGIKSKIICLPFVLLVKVSSANPPCACPGEAGEL